MKKTSVVIQNSKAIKNWKAIIVAITGCPNGHIQKMRAASFAARLPIANSAAEYY
jgi:hypothetical protein